MKKKRLLPLGILAVLVLAALIYTRPMTLEAMFGLDITQSELVYTDYLTVSIDEPGRAWKAQNGCAARSARKR